MKTNEYRLIEYLDDEDNVIARVTMCKDEIVSIKIVEDCLTNKEELTELKAFVDEISSIKWKYDTDDESINDFYKKNDIDITSGTTSTYT